MASGAMDFEFTMPPALAGDNNEVSADGEGASNFLSVTGGLAAILVALAVAAQAKEKILSSVGADADSNVSVSVN